MTASVALPSGSFGRRFAALVVTTLFASQLVGASCGHDALGVMPGVVNDPRNLSLRRAILTYGTSRLCGEMQRRSVPLKLRDEDPTIGRFYATSCFSQELANGNLFVQFAGHGYVWTNLTKRMGFEAGGAVEYDHDFLMDGTTMYVYFRQRSTSAANFKATVVENPAAASVGGVPVSPGQNVGDVFGAQILKNEMARGFTVVRENSGSVYFGLGVVEKGTRPSLPYEVRADERVVVANERVEVHQDQRDFAGPFDVRTDDGALYLTVSLDGAPAADVLVLPRATGEAWLKQHVQARDPGPMSGLPLLDEAVYSGATWRRIVPVPKGSYFVVFDNTATAGKTNPTAYAGDDRAVLVRYAVEVGEAP